MLQQTGKKENSTFAVLSRYTLLWYRNIDNKKKKKFTKNHWEKRTKINVGVSVYKHLIFARKKKPYTESWKKNFFFLRK